MTKGFLFSSRTPKKGGAIDQLLLIDTTPNEGPHGVNFELTCDVRVKGRQVSSAELRYRIDKEEAEELWEMLGRYLGKL